MIALPTPCGNVVYYPVLLGILGRDFKKYSIFITAAHESGMSYLVATGDTGVRFKLSGTGDYISNVYENLPWKESTVVDGNGTFIYKEVPQGYDVDAHIELLKAMREQKREQKVEALKFENEIGFDVEQVDFNKECLVVVVYSKGEGNISHVYRRGQNIDDYGLTIEAKSNAKAELDKNNELDDLMLIFVARTRVQYDGFAKEYLNV